MFEGRRYVQQGYEGRAIRFADQATRGGVATTAYSFAMSSHERDEMARRITAALNATRHLTTDQIEAMAPLRRRAPDRQRQTAPDSADGDLTPCDWCLRELPDEDLQNETEAGDAICDTCATKSVKANR